MYYCKELSFLPKVPEKFLDFIIQCPMDKVRKGSRRSATLNGEVVENCDYSNSNIKKYNPDLLEWIKSNICVNEFFDLVDKTVDEPDDLKIRPFQERPLGLGQWVIMKSENSEYNTPHNDFPRTNACGYSLKYFVELGGPKVKTTWYQEKEYPEIREGYIESKTYDNLTPVYSKIAKINTWYLFRSVIIHGVENINNTRTAITTWF